MQALEIAERVLTCLGLIVSLLNRTARRTQGPTDQAEED